jgi:hypothetical protein
MWIGQIFPTKPTPPQIFLGLVIVLAVGVFVGGAYLLYLSIGAEPTYPEALIAARWAVAGVMGVALLVAVLAYVGIKWLE